MGGGYQFHVAMAAGGSNNSPDAHVPSANMCCSGRPGNYGGATAKWVDLIGRAVNDDTFACDAQRWIGFIAFFQFYLFHRPSQ